MRLAIAIVLTLCFVAFASATCLARVNSEVVDATSGSTDVSLSENSDLTSPTACKVLLADYAGKPQCCSADALTKLGTIADNIAAALSQAKTTFTNEITSVDLFANLDQQTKDQINSVPKLKDALNKIQSAINTFKKNAPNHFGSCVDTIENYIAGALCSLCRPDFVPNVLSIDNSTGVVKRTWKWAPATCDGLSRGCSPLWQDIDALLLSFYDTIVSLLNDPQIGPLLADADIRTEFPNRDDVRPCVQAARRLAGNNTDVTKACRTAVCYGLVRGLRNPEVANDGFEAVGGFFSGLGGKRNAARDLKGLVRHMTKLSGAFSRFATFENAKRQSTGADQTAYDGTVDATGTGSQNTIGTGVGANPGSSAAGLAVSVVAVLLVIFAAMF